MITLTFPDGARREYPDGVTGRVVADIVTGATPAVPIAPFSPGRF